MAISRDEVLHVARLARLALTEEEIERLTSELDKILDAVGVVAELDLAEVPTTSHPLDLSNVWAEDVAGESLRREDSLANAPDASEGAFRVPPWRE
jgi:aspartyl-tRNA(Asn)/glutamyl-tRNA(Gln) amidotransferase subunit C